MSIHSVIIDTARHSVPYQRRFRNDIRPGERTPVRACAWELEGLGGIYYFADGINPNLPGAKKLEVGPDLHSY